MKAPDAFTRISASGLFYLATPYSKFPRGIHVAFCEASKLAADLMSMGIDVYSPIAHTHPMAMYGHISPLNHSVWLKFDEKMMARCDALIVAKMETWDKSYGIAHEITVFEKARKPIFYLDPETKVLE
jgi:hypothetical protein